MILVVGFLSMSGTISLFWFKIPSSAKSTPDIEKKKRFSSSICSSSSRSGGGDGDGDGDGGGSSCSNSILLLEVIPVKVNYNYLHYIELHV